MLALILFLCTLFFLSSFRDQGPISIEHTPVQPVPLAEGLPVSGGSGQRYLVAGDPKKALYGDIHSQTAAILDLLGLPWEPGKEILPEDLQPGEVTLVFTDDTPGKYLDLQDLEQFISQGGKAIFGAGLPEIGTDAYLLPIQGVMEQAGRVNNNRLRFCRDFFPVQEPVMAYGGYNMSTRITVRQAAEIYVEDADTGVPLVYTYPYGQGEILMINGTFLADPRCSGFLSASLSILEDCFLYPVLGTELLYLDNFPAAAGADDAACLRLYGRTTEAFVEDLVWPALQGMSGRNEIPYTVALPAASTVPDSFPRLSGSAVRSALRFGAELAYGSYGSGRGDFYRNQDLLREVSSQFPGYEITSRIPLGDRDLPEGFLGDSIRMVRGDLGDRQSGFSFTGDRGVFPRATEGLNLDGGGMLELCSAFSAWGMVSHSLDMARFTVMEEAVWDRESSGLEDFEKRVLQGFPALEKITLGEAINPLRSYLSLGYAWEQKPDGLHLQAGSFLPGQAFLLKAPGEIRSARGAEYEALSGPYYLIRLQQPEAVLHFA